MKSTFSFFGLDISGLACRYWDPLFTLADMLFVPSALRPHLRENLEMIGALFTLFRSISTSLAHISR